MKFIVMKILCANLVAMLFLVRCEGQNKSTETTVTRVGGPCEGCEAIYEFGSKRLRAVDTLVSFIEEKDKLKITGIVYKRDGITPAEGVILYVYHTDAGGVYPARGNERDWSRRHGQYRGWIKTEREGKYTFYTSKPGHYPSRSEPAHVHFIVKEADKNEYYISDINFDDDPLLTARDRNNRTAPGGSGVLRLRKENGIWIAERNIILGLNITNYE
jgi:protocatechuate 3,4-dioxygenase, beta subunit